MNLSGMHGGRMVGGAFDRARGDNNETKISCEYECGKPAKTTIDAGKGNDDIHVHTNFDGSVDVTVNDETHHFTAEQAQNLVVKGGSGSDSITYSGSALTSRPNITIDGGSGNDMISSSSPTHGNIEMMVMGAKPNMTLNGSSGSDMVSAEGLHGSQIDGGSGSDLIIGSSGRDRIDGGSGSDLIVGGSGDDRIDGGAGRDILAGGKGDDYIQGGAGDDRIYGGRGDDYIVGGAGDDTIKGGSGDDFIRGDFDGRVTIMPTPGSRQQPVFITRGDADTGDKHYPRSTADNSLLSPGDLLKDSMRSVAGVLGSIFK